MKATIDKDGTITYFPESELEEYAVRAWLEKYFKPDSEHTPAIKVSTELVVEAKNIQINDGISDFQRRLARLNARYFNDEGTHKITFGDLTVGDTTPERALFLAESLEKYRREESIR